MVLGVLLLSGCGAPEDESVVEPIADEMETSCPEPSISTSIDFESGSSCEDYESEAVALSIGCVAECDREKAHVLVVRAAAAACSEWCSSKGCGTASFVPTERCEDYACSPDSGRGTDPECSSYESCRNIPLGPAQVNCFCRDLIPT